jgi:hypothetical protein
MTKAVAYRDIEETLVYIVEHMVTKDDLDRFATKDDLKQFATKIQFVGLEERMVNMQREMRSFRLDIRDLTAKVENIVGYGKEIDHAFERIGALEKHAGLDTKKTP